MSKFLHNNNGAKATAIPEVFCENSQPTIWENEKDLRNKIFSFFHKVFNVEDSIIFFPSGAYF